MNINIKIIFKKKKNSLCESDKKKNKLIKQFFFSLWKWQGEKKF